MNESGSFVQVWMKSRAFCIKYSSSTPTAPVKFSTKLKPQKLKPNSILRLRFRICCVSPGRAKQTGEAFQRFLGWVFLCLPCKQFSFDKRILFLARTLVLLWYSEWFTFSPTLMLLRVITLYSFYLFDYQKDKISRGNLRARIFSGGFLHLFKTSRDWLCLTFARTNLRKYMLCL